MQAVTPIVVHVIGGTDWSAVAAAISGGFVGLAGISATVWSTVRTSARADALEKTAAKRAAYVDCLAAINGCMSARARAASEPRSARASDAMNRAIASATTEVYLLALSGPPDVAVLSGQALTEAADVAKAGQGNLVMSALIVAMREDLGESAFGADPFAPSHTGT
jgi:hypothetical protein